MSSELENRSEERIVRRNLRDASDPLSTPDSVYVLRYAAFFFHSNFDCRFISYYRLNKEAFKMVLEQIAPIISRNTKIPPPLLLATALRFLAVGSFQAVIGKDFDIGLERTTVCKVLWKVIYALEATICPNFIKLEMSTEEAAQSKANWIFFETTGIPGVVGCIDGTHVKIIKPSVDDSLFFNRKGYYSINVMIVSKTSFPKTWL